jgi:hypothetical protein
MPWFIAVTMGQRDTRLMYETRYALSSSSPCMFSACKPSNTTRQYRCPRIHSPPWYHGTGTRSTRRRTAHDGAVVPLILGTHQARQSIVCALMRHPAVSLYY